MLRLSTLRPARPIFVLSASVLVIGAITLLIRLRNRSPEAHFSPESTAIAAAASVQPASHSVAPFPDRLPTSGTKADTSSADLPSSPLLQSDLTRVRRILNGEITAKISRAEADGFLARRGRTAANLLAVFSLLPESEFLSEAAERFPDDPRVQLAMIAQTKSDPEHASWIERFRDTNPENPLGAMYAAERSIHIGDFGAAAELLAEASARPGLYTWMSENITDRQALLIDSGYSPLEAHLFASFAEQMPYVQSAMRVGRELLEWNTKNPSADPAANDAVLKNTYALGNLFSTPEGSRTLIGQLVGIALEKRALALLPAESTPDWLNVSVGDRIERLDQQSARIKDLAKLSVVLGTADPELISGYMDRFRLNGEPAALDWLATQRIPASPAR